MPATKADVGTRKKCFTCKNIMVCKETEYNGETKYQWQNDDGTAHYGFNKKTSKPFCKAKGKQQETDEQPPQQQSPITSDSLRKIYDEHFEELEYPETMDIYIKALKDCEIMGIPHGVASGHYQKLVVSRLD